MARLREQFTAQPAKAWATLRPPTGAGAGAAGGPFMPQTGQTWA